MAEISSSFGERARKIRNHNGQLRERMGRLVLTLCTVYGESTLGQAVDSKTGLIPGSLGVSDSDKQPQWILL